MENFGEYLRSRRRARALTLGQLSQQAGVHKATLSRWEAGTHTPRVPELVRVLDALRASPAERARGLNLLDTPRTVVALRHEADAATLRVSLGDLLYGLRLRAARTRADVARAAGVSRSLVSQWENNAALPTTAQLHAVAFALGASAEEVGALSTRTFAPTPLGNSRDALLDRFQHTMLWDPGMTRAMYTLHLLSLLAGFGRLLREGRADIGDLALIVSGFGNSALAWDNDTAAQDHYHRRALALAAPSRRPLHFHMAYAVRTLLDPKTDPRPLSERVSDALAWQPRFPTAAGRAYLLSFLAGALAEEAPDEALRLGGRYLALVADDPDESPCRLRDFGNLLRRSGRPAESVAFIAALQPQDAYRAGLKQLEMTQGLALLGSVAEAGRCLGAAKAILSGVDAAHAQAVIRDLERSLG